MRFLFLRRGKGFIGYIFFFFCSTVFCSSLYSVSKDSQSNISEKLINRFLSMKTIQGNFIQNDTYGNVLRGEIFVDRPGKFYFNYNPSSPIRIIADGNNLAIHNSKLDTWSVYPLRNTDFDMIFSDKRDKLQKSIQRIDVEDTLITIVLKSRSGGQKVSLVFDRSSYRLLYWKVIDDLGRSTVVEILNYEENLALESKLFVIPYDQIHKK